MNLEAVIKEINAHYPELKIKDDEDVYAFLNIYEILKFSYSKVDRDILKTAFNKREELNPENMNDFYYLVFSSMIENKGITKVAYPLNMGALKEDPMEEADLAKWSKLVHKVYDSVTAGHMSFDNALDYYSGFLDAKTGEDERFKKWVVHYKDGEHLKYNSGEVAMKKEAFQFPLNSSGFYPPENEPLPGEDMLFEDAKESARQKDNYDDWKSKLHAAIRRIDKLLRQSDSYLEVDMQSDLADQLHSLDMDVRKIRMKSTASDVVFKTATKFKKQGFDEGHDILISLAQEVPEAVEPPLDEVVPDEIEEAPVEPLGAPEAAPLEEELPGAAEEGVLAPEAEPAAGPESTISGAITDASGAQPGEYDMLAGEITLEIASAKLEAIAGRLADRRTIRKMAEFDIMLDKLGIASMFPELAEAQSKLIDAYSYALVRVTKMLGMLSSGKELSEISDAKSSEIANKTMRDVNKTFEGASPEAGPKGAEAIKEEFEGGEDAAQPAPEPPPAEEV
jgi:hypothetical protein